MNLEKQTRQGADMHSTAKVLICIVQLCYEAKQWTLLNEHIVMLTKKRLVIFIKFREIDFETILMTNFRSQLKQAVAKMVQECCKWITEGTLSSKDVEK